jgi:hypothetical protein
MVLLLAIAALIGGGYGWYRYNYPYGAKHACLKCLGASLLMYADRHGSRFPSGGGCPEASLSLLYRAVNESPYVLSGKTKSAEAAEQILKRGELLGPDTCDWHYVEGLTQCDDPRLALVWDKVGLGHNGERLAGGGHTILRVGSLGEEVIPESEWSAFLEEQERLMAARTDAAKKGLPELTAKIRLPSGEIVDHFDGPYTLSESFTSANGNSGSGSGSSSQLTASLLRWNRLTDDCTTTYTLSFNGMTSKRVVIKTSQGKAKPDSITFVMQADGKK